MNYKIKYRNSDGLLLSFAYSPTGTDHIDMRPSAGETQVACDTDVDMSDREKVYIYDSGTITEHGLGKLSLSCDKTDTDSDGIIDMPADGSSVATFTIQKKDSLGNDMTDASDDDVITISADRGKLSALSTQLVNGSGTFTLTSINETVIIEVSIRNDSLGKTEEYIQLLP